MPKRFIQRYLRTNSFLTYSFAVVFLIVSILLGVSIGTVSVPFTVILQLVLMKVAPFLSFQIEEQFLYIVSAIRLPRVVLAGLVGASLAIAGAAFQGLLRNPLADPYTLGVSSGASVGAVVTLFFHLSLPILGLFTLPFMSIFASSLTIFFVLFFTKKIDISMKVETIILTGIIVSSFLGALLSLMIALTNDELRQIIGWLLGSVAMRGWQYVWILLPFFLFGSILLWIQANELDVLSFGEEKAQYLGVNVHRKKLMILLGGSILTGAAVSVSGTIGFVGLVIPHFVRQIWGPRHRQLLILSMLFGGGFLILADVVSRTIISPTELPIGVITAIIGAPVFGLVLMKQKHESSGSS
ncbi:FecCD family ABC transporter permease [Bacillus sp. 2205SS5-2]|uniref:FecCD family ABC transporter permease n=1 Tax=Bacillus sp. 2205SS5-2 TaxID=3109031 RepID=UPI0030073105